MRSAALITGLLALLPLTAHARPAPASTWPMFQYDSTRNAVFDSPALDVAWKADLGAKINGGLSIVGNTLYVETFASKLYALNVQSGKTLWVRSLNNIAMTAPVVTGGLVIVGTGTSERIVNTKTEVVLGRPRYNDSVDAYNATTGQGIWHFWTVGEDMPTGVLAWRGQQQEFVFSNGDGHVYALNVATGAQLWKRQMPGVSTMSSLAVYNGTIYGLSGFLSGPFYFDLLAANENEIIKNYRWTWAVRPDDGQFIWINDFGYTDATPSVADGKIFGESVIPTDKQSLRGYNVVYGADASTGKVLWEYKSAVGPLPVDASGERAVAGMYDAGTYYQALPYPSQFAAFDGQSGRLRWITATRAPVKMGGVLREGLLYLGDTAGNFYTIRASDGAIVFEKRFPGIFTVSPPVIVGNSLFVANGGAVYAVRLTDLQPASARTYDRSTSAMR